MKSPKSLEIGHKFYAALQTGLVSVQKQSRPRLGIPREISFLLVQAGLPEFYKFPTVFLMGRVYRSESTNSDRQIIFQEIDPWRDLVKKYVKKAGLMPLDGVAFDLHEQDAPAGAGRAFLHAYLSPLGIIDGQGRLGNGSIEEAKFILRFGGNVGFIVRKEDYVEVCQFLSGKRSRFPTVLPAYFGVLDLEPDDIINGYQGVEAWLKRQRKKLSSRPFKERDIPKKIRTLIDYFSLFYAPDRQNDLLSYRRILSSLEKKR